MPLRRLLAIVTSFLVLATAEAEPESEEQSSQSANSRQRNSASDTKEHEDHVSPDQRWRVHFTKDGEEVTKITIQSAEGAGQPLTLYGHEFDVSCPMPTWVVWSPECDMLALRLGDGPRFTRTLLYRLKDGAWQPVVLPEFYAIEKKTALANGFNLRDELIDADHWQNSNTLVVKYFGSFEKGDEGDGYYQFVKIHIDASGQACVTGAVDVPGEE